MMATEAIRVMMRMGRCFIAEARAALRLMPPETGRLGG